MSSSSSSSSSSSWGCVITSLLLYGGPPPWIASIDVCLGPVLSRWFPGADWGRLSILFSVFLVVLTISVEPRMLLWWSTCCLEVWLHDLPIGVSTVWCGLWCLSLLSAARSRCYVWSWRVIPSIILSIFLCATASASIWAVVKAQVSLPYVITRSTYSLNTFSWSACLLCGFSWCCVPCWRQPIPKWYVSWSLALGLHPLKLSFPGRRTFQPLLWLFHRLRLWPSRCDYLAWSWFFPGAYWGPLVCYRCWCRQAFLVVLVEYLLSGLCHRRRLGGKGAGHLCWFLSPPSLSYWWWHPGGMLWRALEKCYHLVLLLSLGWPCCCPCGASVLMWRHCTGVLG